MDVGLMMGNDTGVQETSGGDCGPCSECTRWHEFGGGRGVFEGAG